MLFYEIEPFGTEIEMYGHAMNVAALYNVHRDKKKHPNPIRPSEVMPKWDVDDIAEKQLLQVKQLNQLVGGKEESREHNS